MVLAVSGILSHLSQRVELLSPAGSLIHVIRFRLQGVAMLCGRARLSPTPYLCKRLGDAC
jgi:hypothetical protein